MSDANLYRVLGVGPAASADEIRSAYRDLVKKYHPDLYFNAREKAAATEKLRQINEAYAVLGKPQRRQRYDEQSVQQAQSRRRPPVARRQRPAPSHARRGGLRQKSAEILKRLKDRRYISKKRVGYALAAGIAILAVMYASGGEPRLTTLWTLVEKVEISSSKSSFTPGSAGQRWIAVGEYGDVSECAAMLKKIVRADEQEGSRVIYDERRGTMAITVYVKSEASPGQDASPSNATSESSAATGGAFKNDRLKQPEGDPIGEASPQSVSTKRVRNLECREIQKVESPSRVRRILTSLGLGW
ncbi:MAG TPA: J domain-containing protein [Verrucomicrobiae bacterium]|nr:J domain-containing protein [Verrucomicrobiae bacterium]